MDEYVLSLRLFVKSITTMIKANTKLVRSPSPCLVLPAGAAPPAPLQSFRIIARTSSD